MTLQSALQQHFGYNRFLAGQEEVVQSILNEQELCVVMPTGAGKSLCYQLPILMRSGYGLVVSPLISLMKDQVDALRARGVSAAYVNSTLTYADQQRVLHDTALGNIKILYVAPERFRAGMFGEFLTASPPRLLVVDEAHCISQWGHDFRPDYLRLGERLGELNVPQVCAFTATATPLVRDDIRAHLARPDMAAYVTGFERPNLSFSVIQCRSGGDKDSSLQRLLQERKPTIVYASTRKAVEQLVSTFGCIGYHAGMDDASRARAQEHFMTDPCPVLAATNAFGMGIDRPDVRRVIHYNMPGSLEAYYQEAGRAGRDGEPADCILLFAYQDRYVQEFLIDMNNPGERLLRQLYSVLRRKARVAGGAELAVGNADLAEEVAEAKSDGQVGSALRILEKNGVIERGYRSGNRGTLRFLQPVPEARQLHQHESTQRSRFVYRAACQFGERLAEGVAVSPDELAQLAGLRHEQIMRVLRALQGELIRWTPPFNGRPIRLLQPDADEPQMDFAELQRKRDFDRARLDDVVEYTRTRACRQRFLVDYFGQTIDDWTCERCDLCTRQASGPKRELSATEKTVVREILQAVQDFDGRFGRGRIARMLAGAESADILQSSLCRHRGYGRLGHMSQSQLYTFMDALQAAGCIEQVGDAKYPCVDITTLGVEVLAGGKDVSLNVPKSRDKGGRAARKSRPAASTTRTKARDAGPENDLFAELKTLRAELAGKRGVPPYVILTDAALHGLVEDTPVSAEEAVRIKGIGDVKARTVVPTFLKAIAAWRAGQL